MRRALWWLVVLVPTAAQAGDKHYPWKANVERATFEAEQGECAAAAKQAMKKTKLPNPYFQPAPGTGVAGAMGSGFAAGMARGLAQGKAFNNTYYGCMTAKGYSQRRLPDADWKTMRKLSKDEQKAAAFRLMSAPAPLHPEMPRDEYD